MSDVIPCGLCFDYALDYANKNFDNPNVVVVHGILSTQWNRPFWHAWIEDQGRAYDWQRLETKPEGLPIDVFRKFFTVHFERQYTPEQALVMAMRTGHKGPWGDPDEDDAMVEELRQQWTYKPNPDYRLVDDPDWQRWHEERREEMEHRLGRYRVRPQLSLEKRLLKLGGLQVLLPAGGEPDAKPLLKHGEAFVNALSPLAHTVVAGTRHGMPVVTLREPKEDGSTAHPYIVEIDIIGEASFDAHGDAARRWQQDPDQTLWAGYALWDGLWRQHSWVTDLEGRFYDNHPAPDAYFGVGLTETEARSFARQFGEPHVFENPGHFDVVASIAEQGSADYYDFEEYYPESASGELLEECAEEDRAYGRNVVWCGRQGEMLRADTQYLQHIWGNIFDADKLAVVVRGIQDAEERVGFYAPVAQVSKVDLTSIRESIEYADDEGLDRPLSTGDEELDRYLVDPDEVLLEYVDPMDYEDGEDDPDYIADRDDAKAELEGQLIEAITNQDGDLGAWQVTIRDGNHRGWGALLAGEPYIFVWLDDNQLQDLRKGTWPEPEASELRAMLV